MPEWGMFFNVMTAIVVVGGVATVVLSPYTSGIISAWFNGFSGSLTAAKK
jgi:hypothetical protein